jgi:hypothetical protein
VDGRAVYGNADATGADVDNYGGYFEAAGQTARGVYGFASAASGINYGVRGNTSSATGFAGYFTGVVGSKNYFQRSVGIGTEYPYASLEVVSANKWGWAAGNGWGDVCIGNNSDVLPYGLCFGVATSGGGAGISRIWPKSNHLILGSSAGGDTLIMTASSTNSGKVGIKRTPTTNPFEVEGAASKTTAGDWLANSDARIKTDVKTISNALKTLDKVRLVDFEYTPEYMSEHPEIKDHRYLNVIAQEFAEVFPDYVQESGESLADGEEILQVDTHPLTIYSAAAVQELHVQMKQKDAEIAQLREQNRQMEERLSRLESVLLSGNAK